MGNKDVDDRIAAFLSRELHPAPDAIMEVGFGRGRFSAILRSVFPEARIVGYDRNTKIRQKGSPAFADLSEVRFLDIRRDDDADESFDLGSFASIEMPFWWHFDIAGEEEYLRFLQALSLRLRLEGIIFGVFLSDRFDNSRQSLLLRYKRLMCLAMRDVDESDPMVAREDTAEFTGELLSRSLGYSVRIEEIPIGAGEETRTACLRRIAEARPDVGTALIPRIEAVEASIEAEGVENGYCKLLLARRD
jgi:hypothetical protein